METLKFGSALSGMQELLEKRHSKIICFFNDVKNTSGSNFYGFGGGFVGPFWDQMGNMCCRVCVFFFVPRPGGGPGPYFDSKTGCFTRVIFKNWYSV